MKEIRLQIPSHADNIEVVRMCLYGIASKLKFTYEEIEDMKVAVSEACTNAVLYGSEEKSIDIRFTPCDQALMVTVANEGQPFTSESEPSITPPLQGVAISELPVGGLGLYLMQALMDEVTVNSSEQGTEVVMVKKRSQ